MQKAPMGAFCITLELYKTVTCLSTMSGNTGLTVFSYNQMEMLPSLGLLHVTCNCSHCRKMDISNEYFLGLIIHNSWGCCVCYGCTMHHVACRRCEVLHSQSNSYCLLFSFIRLNHSLFM